MSRTATSKSRSDKGKDKDKDRGGGSASVPVPPTHTDIIAGRYTEADWLTLLETEDSEEFTYNIVDDIVNSTLHIIYDNYIQKQLCPYTVAQARTALLQNIEWEFIENDQGESNPHMNYTWLEEREPEPCIPDAWGQGSVPLHPTLPSPLASPGDDYTPTPSRSPDNLHEILDDMPTTFNDTDPNTELDAYTPIPSSRRKDREPGKEQAKGKQKKLSKRRKFKPYLSPLQSAKLDDITKSIEESELDLIMSETVPKTKPLEQSDSMLSACQSILKAQVGRPPGTKAVTYDSLGNVISIVRLNPEQLPNNRVPVKYEVIDPAMACANERLLTKMGRRTARKAKTAPKMAGPMIPVDRGINLGVKGMDAATSLAVIMASALTVGRGKDFKTMHKNMTLESNAMNTGVVPLPPPLVKSMEISPGVIIIEGERTMRGPKLQLAQDVLLTATKMGALRPIELEHVAACQLKVEQVVQASAPIIRELPPYRPVPPITKHVSSTTKPFQFI